MFYSGSTTVEKVGEDKTKSILTQEQSRFLDRCRTGDKDALRQFVDKHYDRVYRLAYTMVGANEANDLAQETFAAALKSLKNFRGDAQVSTWLVAMPMMRLSSSG